MRNHHGGAVTTSLLAGVAALGACADLSSPTEPLPVTVGDPSPAPTATSTAVGEIVVNTSTSGVFEGVALA